MDTPPAATWEVRHLIFTTIAECGTAPDATAIAATLPISPETARDALTWLSDHAEIVIDPSGDVVMAHPFSNVETPFKVTIGDRSWWANCAWDTFGILAVLDADGTIHASYAEDGAPARITIHAGVPAGTGVVHLLLPAREWTKDYVDT